MLQRSFLYLAKKEKARKVSIILSQLSREYGMDMVHLKRIINLQLNRELRSKFHVRSQNHIQPDQYTEYLAIINTFSFIYLGKFYGTDLSTQCSGLRIKKQLHISDDKHLKMHFEQ